MKFPGLLSRLPSASVSPVDAGSFSRRPLLCLLRTSAPYRRLQRCSLMTSSRIPQRPRCQRLSRPSFRPNWHPPEFLPAASGLALVFVAFVAPGCFIASVAKTLRSGGGNSPPKGTSGGGGGGSGGGQELGRIAANSDEDDEEEEEVSEEEFEEGDIEQYFEDDVDEEDYVDPTAPFECHTVKAVGLPIGPGVPRDVDLFAGIHCQSGFRCTQEELRKDLRTLSQTEGIEHVEIRVTPVKGTKGKKCDVSFVFKSVNYPEMKSFNISGAAAIPDEEVDKVMDTYQKELTSGVSEKNVSIRTIGMIRNIVEKWYQDRGYIMSYIRNFDGLQSGQVSARVVEGRVNKVDVKFVDEEGNEKKRGNATPHSFIRRELSFVQGQLYNQEDSRRALRDLIATGMYENVQVLPEQNRKDERLVDVTVMVKERAMRTTEIELDWNLRRQGGIPMPETAIPGATIIVDHRNARLPVLGSGWNVTGTVSTSSIFDPRDIGYKIEVRRPYVFGESDKNKTSLSGIVFNSRRISSVFTGGTMSEDVPSVFVHRSGAKFSLNEQYNCNSRGSLAIVGQEIMTYDDSGTIISRGFRTASQHDGPPTTLGDGQDIQLYVQGNVVRDTTYIVNGSTVGSRDIYTVDQGTGIGGFFNRHVGSWTRFLKLVGFEGFKAPIVWVLHGKAGNCVGDLASYDAFTLGGPHSVRGVGLGDLGTCRRFVELATELRVPTPIINQQMFAFVEYGTDLNSSEDVPGNPTVYFRKPGSGMTWGGGIKIGPARIEYAHDVNLGRGSAMLNIGERF